MTVQELSPEIGSSAADETPAVEDPPSTDGASRQSAIVAIPLVFLTIALVFVWIMVISHVDGVLYKEISAPWKRGVDVILTSGTTNFEYDYEEGKLVLVGPLTDGAKLSLLGLLKQDTEANKLALPSYMTAIDRLAFQSNGIARQYGIWILILGGVSGVVGVNLRSLVNFIGVSCLSDKLDVPRWWPWYFVRPVTGFILGVVIVLLVRSGMFSSGNALPGDTMAWVAISVLAGFGADEFTQRLRLLTRTLFGQGKGE